VSLSCSACLIVNPAFSEGADGGADGTGTAAGEVSAGEPTTGSAGAGSSTGSAGAGSATGSTSGGSSTGGAGAGTDADSTTGADGTTGADSTTGAPFEPMTLKGYETASCTQGLHCASGMNAVPAVIRAFECFRVQVDPPFALTRVGFEVRLIVGEPMAVLEVLPFDTDAGLPLFEPIASRPLGAIDQGMVYRSFSLEPPILVDTPDFCVVITGGGTTSSLAIRSDPTTMSPGDAFFTMDNEGGSCDEPLTDLKSWYDAPFAHYCIDADIAPP
jgi:hypothetical protein